MHKWAPPEVWFRGRISGELVLVPEDAGVGCVLITDRQEDDGARISQQSLMHVSARLIVRSLSEPVEKDRLDVTGPARRQTKDLAGGCWIRCTGLVGVR